MRRCRGRSTPLWRPKRRREEKKTKTRPRRKERRTEKGKNRTRPKRRRTETRPAFVLLWIPALRWDSALPVRSVRRSGPVNPAGGVRTLWNVDPARSALLLSVDPVRPSIASLAQEQTQLGATRSARISQLAQRPVQEG